MPEEDAREHEGGSVTPAAWFSSQNAEELLCFAAPQIPREHLSLVLAEIAEATVYYWYVGYPRDWRLAWAVATLRAWCFGHATNAELMCARDEALDAIDVPPSASHADLAARAAATCVVSCTTVPLQRAASPGSQAHDIDCMGLPDLIGGTVHFASLASQHGFDGEASCFQSAQAHFAVLVRRLIIYPTGSNDDWVGTPGLVFAGDAMLRIDGRKIGDVVRRKDFARLSAARAVAFDEAEQNPEAESPLPSGYREHLRQLAAKRAAPKARQSDCVMSLIVVDGREVGTRISCYGHHENLVPVTEATVGIDQHALRTPTLSRRIIDQPRPSVTQGDLESAKRKRRAVVPPDTDWAPGSRWLTALIISALSLTVFALVEWGGASGESVTSVFPLALAAAAGLWMGIECIVCAGKEPANFTPAFGAFGIVFLLGTLVVFVMGSGVRFVLDASHSDTPGRIQQREASIRRDRSELEVRRTKKVESRLQRKEIGLARLRPVSVRVDAVLAVVVLAPILLALAFLVSQRLSHTEAWHELSLSSPNRAPLWVTGFDRRRRPTLT